MLLYPRIYQEQSIHHNPALGNRRPGSEHQRRPGIEQHGRPGHRTSNKLSDMIVEPEPETDIGIDPIDTDHIDTDYIGARPLLTEESKGAITRSRAKELAKEAQAMIMERGRGGAAGSFFNTHSCSAIELVYPLVREIRIRGLYKRNPLPKVSTNIQQSPHRLLEKFTIHLASYHLHITPVSVLTPPPPIIQPPNRLRRVLPLS
ncbi:unnamed protein product [Cochlearia groenlandica]